MDPNQQPNQADSNTQNTQETSASGLGSATGTLVDQAKQLLNKGRLNDLLGQVPQPVKDAGTQVVTQFNKLTTTQKLLGGAALVLGVTYLTRGSKGKSAKAGKAKDATATLEELLLFVNDRIEGYKRAAAESQDTQKQGYYKQLISQSQQFANELNGHLRQQGGERVTGTTVKGKFYRAWMDTKAAVTGADEKAILGSNIYGEEWAIKAYEDALDQGTLTGSLRQAVERQYAQSQKTYKELKNMEGKQ